MKWGIAFAALAAAGVAAFGLARAQGPESAVASSHREAPVIADDPAADNTDLYAFVSPDRTDTVTIVANYIPLEEPAGGPNFAKFDDSVLYELKVDQDGDAKEDIAYQFRFQTTVGNGNTFLYNTGRVTSLDDEDLNVRQTYTVTRLTRKGKDKGDLHGKGEVLNTDPLTTPPVNIGPRSTPQPDYDALAAAAVHDLPGGIKVFAGQRDDPFYVDLGSIFDLAGLRPFNPFHLIPLGAAAGVDGVAGFNTHSIAIQVPIDQLVKIPNTTIGVYASASRQRISILQKDGTTKTEGPYVQVSRLGHPLINEVVIPLGDKDDWNRQDPSDDSQFEHYYSSPEVSRLENLLYGALPPVGPSNGHAGGALMQIQETGRTDLDLILLTGVPGLNFTGATQADLLRVNTSIKPGINGACPGGTASPTPPDRLAVLNADLCGYPNGRRLGDDVVDIDLRVFAQGYGAFLNTAFGLPNLTPNNLLGDGVDANEKPFMTTFPYLASPHPGYDHGHHGS